MNKTNWQLSFLTIIITVIIIVTASITGRALESFELISENRQLKLYMNKATLEIAVQRKESGQIWYSNPPERDEIERRARGRTRDRLEAQLAISYYTPRDRRHYLNSYTDSVLHEQYDISLIDGGVRIDFQLGQKWDDEDIIPVIIGEERFQEQIHTQITDDGDRGLVEDLYQKVYLEEKPEDFERVNVHGVDKEELFGDFILVSSEELTGGQRRSFIENFLNRLQENRNLYDSLGDIVWNDIEQLVAAPAYVLRERIPAWDREDLAEILGRIGYSPEEAIFDHQQNNIDPPDANVRVFNIPLEYRLEGDSLLVTIPVEEIVYPIDVADPEEDGQLATFPLYSINLLEFFGAAAPETEGYIFVPDGSGALINLNKETGSVSYQQRLYGTDFSERPRDEISYSPEQLYLPVYGLKQERQGWMAIIEKGDTLARINAAVAGQTFDYNRVFPGFVTMPSAEVSLTGSGDLSGDLEDALQDQSMNIYQARLYDQDISVRFLFLEGEEAEYSGMARNYQDYLVEKHQLERLNPVDRIPLLLEITGSIHATEPVMGIPRRVVRPLTTYQQTSSIIEQLAERGVANLKLVYQGWLEGGSYHDYPQEMNLETAAGSQQELKDLLALLDDKDFEFFPEVSFLNVYNNQWLNGFSTRNDAARFIDRRIAYINRYNIASFMREKREKHIHSPQGLEETINSFLDEYLLLNNRALSLRYPGQQLNSDFNHSEVIDRQDAADIISDELQKMLTERELKLMFRGANNHVLPYTDNLLEIPLYASSHNIIDRGVPFLQMVLQGYYNFTGTAFNLTDNLEEYMLKALETGALPYYHFTGVPSFATKGTDFNNLYAVYYQDWLQEAVEHYLEFDDVLAEVHHLRISNHEQVAREVFVTTYENGTKIAVNYSSETAVIDNCEIVPGNYKVLDRGE